MTYGQMDDRGAPTEVGQGTNSHDASTMIVLTLRESGVSRCERDEGTTEDGTGCMTVRARREALMVDCSVSWCDL